jgi:hypothetical protein
MKPIDFLHKAPIFALAGGMMIFAASDASAIAVNPCPDIVPGADHSSAVLDDVTDNGNGTWTYDFTVCNTSDAFGAELFSRRDTQVIRDWELPFFGDDLGTDEAGITNVVTPDGWAYGIEEVGVANGATGWDGVAAWQTPGDPQKAIFDAAYGGEANNPFNTNTHVLHFYTDVIRDEEMFAPFGISPGDYLSGFGFTADFGPVAAPYQASWIFVPANTGDPQFPMLAPNSPSVQRNPNQAPEPASLALAGLGLGAAAGLRRRKKKHQA